VIGQESRGSSGCGSFSWKRKRANWCPARLQDRARRKILIVEDVVTKGGRVQETIDIVRAHQGHVAGVAMVVDRSNGQTQLACRSST